VRILVDNSAWSRARDALVRAQLERWFASADAEVVTCVPQELEFLRSARNRDEFERVFATLSAWPTMPILDKTGAIAEDIQRKLCDAGQRTRVGVADVIIAATAITHTVTVLHCDHDFALLGRLDGRLRQEWVGSRD